LGSGSGGKRKKVRDYIRNKPTKSSAKKGEKAARLFNKEFQGRSTG